MQIDITQDHIDRGVRKSCTHCPIALAVQEKLGVDSVTVEQEWIYPPDDEVRYFLPAAARDFISYFDWAGRSHVRPFSFELFGET